MIHKSKVKSLLIIGLVLNLTACNTRAVKEEDNKVSKNDLIKIKKETELAYLNDDLVMSEKGYEILVKSIPSDASYLFRLANIYAQTNRPLAATNLYREALVRDAKNSKAWYNLSVIQLKQTAHSLNEMLIYTDIGDPLYVKAKNMLEAIKNLVVQD